MFIRNDYPILEFDDNRDAKINPTTWVDKKFECNKMVITFFPEVVDKLIADGKIVLEKTIGGENIVLVYRFVDTDILITLGAVGCPSCAGNLDLFNAMGAEKVMFCGGGGVLDKKIEVGQLLVVDGAIRDEGFSYHYIKPSKYIYTDKNVTYKMGIEDEDSIRQKLNLIKKYNLTGAAFWQKGFEKDDIWQIVKSQIME